MKRTVKWHLECLHNRISSNDRDITTLNKLIKRIDESQKEIDYYQRQIDRAIKEHKEAFDSEKYLDAKKEAKK